MASDDMPRAAASVTPANTSAAKQRSVNVRLVLTTLLISLTAATLITFVQLYAAYQSAITEARARIDLIASSHARPLIEGLWEVDGARLQDLVDGIALQPDVAFVELVDELQQTYQSGDRNADMLFEQYFPLRHQAGGELGSLRVQIGDEALLARLYRRGISIAITTVLTLALGSLVVLLLFQRWVSRPLQQMARYAEQLRLDHLNEALTLQRPVQAKTDELDQVASAINRMRERLQTDMAERNRFEQQLAEHRDQLEQRVAERTAALQQQSELLAVQNRELDAYAHTVAHDLKIPLTTIRGMSALLDGAGAALTAEQQHAAIETIHRTAIKMSSIIDALLLLASVRRSEDIAPERLDLQHIANEAIQRLADLITQTGAVLTAEGEWPLALGHRQWLEEVWVNYLSNALKYGGTPPRVEFGARLQADGMVRAWVRDHGAGVAANRRAELFLQFSQLDPQSSDGHGLGLSIVKRIVQRLGGTVGCDTADGGGSLFWFSLPAAPP